MVQFQADKTVPKEKVWLTAGWLVSFFIHIAVINHFVGWICTDTAGYWLHAATFTGYDWSEVAKTTSMYYSWGYSLWLMIPFLIASGNMISILFIDICICIFSWEKNIRSVGQTICDGVCFDCICLPILYTGYICCAV